MQTEPALIVFQAAKWIAISSVVTGLTVTALAQSPAATTVAYKILETNMGPIDAEASSTVFSRDGRHFAYITRRGQKFCVVVDGQEGAKYDEIAVGSLIISPDGNRVMYVAGEGKESVVVKGANPGPDAPSTLSFVRIKRHFMVVDGQAGAEYDGFLPDSLFSPDGKRVAYAAGKGEQRFVVVDGTEGAAYDGIANGPIFSPDGKRVAYAVGKGENRFVVVDGRRAGTTTESEAV